MLYSVRIIIVVLAGFLISLGVYQEAIGQPAKTPAVPSTINLVIPYIPGTGADIQTRVVARFLPKYLPGAPTFVVKNDAGAGGRAGVQTVYRSKPDGAAVGGAPELDQIPGLFFLNRDGVRYYFCETTGEGWRAQRRRNTPISKLIPKAMSTHTPTRLAASSFHPTIKDESCNSLLPYTLKACISSN